MTRRYSKSIYTILFCASIVAAPKAIADDCGPGSSNPSNPTCLPGTYVNDQIQQQQQQAAAQAQAQRDADLKGLNDLMEQGRRLAQSDDPGSQDDPGTPAQQCEAANRSIFCALGLACAPANIDCAQLAARPAKRHHRRHY